MSFGRDMEPVKSIMAGWRRLVHVGSVLLVQGTARRRCGVENEMEAFTFTKRIEDFMDVVYY